MEPEYVWLRCAAVQRDKHASNKKLARERDSAKHEHDLGDILIFRKAGNVTKTKAFENNHELRFDGVHKLICIVGIENGPSKPVHISSKNRM